MPANLRNIPNKPGTSYNSFVFVQSEKIVRTVRRIFQSRSEMMIVFSHNHDGRWFVKIPCLEDLNLVKLKTLHKYHYSCFYDILPKGYKHLPLPADDFLKLLTWNYQSCTIKSLFLITLFKFMIFSAFAN